MTESQVREWAEQSLKLLVGASSKPSDFQIEVLADAARELLAMQIEEDAKMCEALVVNHPDDPPANYFDGGCRTCAAAIREGK